MPWIQPIEATVLCGIERPLPTPDHQARYGRGPGVLWRRSRGVVLAHTRTDSTITVLGGGAATVWELLEEPGRLDELVAAIVAESAVDTRAIEREVDAALGELLGRGLLVLIPSGAS